MTTKRDRIFIFGVIRVLLFIGFCGVCAGFATNIISPEVSTILAVQHVNGGLAENVAVRTYEETRIFIEVIFGLFLLVGSSLLTLNSYKQWKNEQS